MGYIGSELGWEIGSITGRYIGKKFFKDKTTGERIGKLVGKIWGSYLPFKNGGYVKKTGFILAHKNNLVIPSWSHLTKHVPQNVKKQITRCGGRKMK